MKPDAMHKALWKADISIADDETTAGTASLSLGKHMARIVAHALIASNAISPIPDDLRAISRKLRQFSELTPDELARAMAESDQRLFPPARKQRARKAVTK